MDSNNCLIDGMKIFEIEKLTVSMYSPLAGFGGMAVLYLFGLFRVQLSSFGRY